jgi:hypothetical protein
VKSIDRHSKHVGAVLCHGTLLPLILDSGQARHDRRMATYTELVITLAKVRPEVLWGWFIECTSIASFRTPIVI